MLSDLYASYYGMKNKTRTAKPGNAPLAVLLMLCLAFVILVLAGKLRVFTVLSGSMAPAIPAGSIAVSVPYDSYQVGDIVTFRQDSGKVTVTHRIAGRSGNVFVTKGDANKTRDPQTVLPSSILGKTVAIVPLAGYLIAFVRTGPGLFIFIILPALVVIANEIRTIIREIRSGSSRI